MRARWLTRNLIVLTLVSLTQDAASELVYPLLPLFLTGVLAAPPVVLGLVEGCAEAAAGISKYVAGRWSDTSAHWPTGQPAATTARWRAAFACPPSVPGRYRTSA